MTDPATGPPTPPPTAVGAPGETEAQAAASAEEVSPELERRIRRLGFRGRSIRHYAARGTLVNAIFTVGTSVLGLIKGFVLAIFLSRSDYGVWGVIAFTILALGILRQTGVGDKFVQQEEEDQEVAFQKAFTIEAIATGAMMLLMLAALPVVLLVYGESKLLVPGLVYIAAVPAGVLQMPIWAHYRRMDYFKQRMYLAIDPVVGFAVGVGLAAAGAGYWALLLSIVAGAWATAIAAVWSSPYKLRFRYDRGTLRSYFSFSWPLFVAVAGGVVIAQATGVITNASLGLAGVGVAVLAANITMFTERVDYLITGSLYPAICAVRDRLDLLHESFVKSNRLALMWGMPFGVGLTLFAADLVNFILGSEWKSAVIVLQIYGVTSALSNVAFNWDAYFRALGNTKPMAVAAVAAMVTFLASAPFMVSAWGLKGLAIAIALQGVVHMTCRAWFLARLFEGFRYITHTLRAIAPTVPAVAVVLIARQLEPSHRTPGIAIGELVVYLAVTAAATIAFEGRLLREARDYLRSPTLAAG